MKKSKILIVILVIVLIALIVAGMYLVDKYKPTTDREDLVSYYGITESDQVAVVRDFQIQDYYAKNIGGFVYLPYEVVSDTLNDRFYVDPEGVLLYTTNSREIAVTLGGAENSYSETIYSDSGITQNTVALSCPAVGLIDGALYLSLDFVKQFTALDYAYYEDPSRIVMTTEYGEIVSAEVLKNTALRVRGGIKSPILKDLAAGEKVVLLDEEENWYKAASEDGVIGYVEKKRLGESSTEILTSSFTEEPFTHILHEGTVSMIWHQVTNMDANAKIGELLAETQGVNVVSPTWFYLNDNEGNVEDLASQSYVDYCHANGIQVWGLVSNLENREVEDEALIARFSTRQHFIQTMVAKATAYGLDGVNLDFEEISQEAGDGYIQMVREMSLACAANGLILSVDNYVPTEYTAHYDRGEQALYVDYIVIMGYDEHYNGSGEGSVASLPFVTAGIEDTIAAGVPENQIILGMPFYTRVWEETPKDEVVSDQEMASDEYVPYELSSRAISMTDQNRLAQTKGGEIVWLEDLGQHYTQWQEDGLTYKMWMEDRDSLEQKLIVLQNHNLAGGSFWKVSMEDPDVWSMIVNYLN